MFFDDVCQCGPAKYHVSYKFVFTVSYYLDSSSEFKARAIRWLAKKAMFHSSF